jgi:antitoxin VapB
MSMNIKNEETHRRAKELAALTGESVAGAVGVAVRERLERLSRERKPDLVEKWLAIGRTNARRLEKL